MSENKKFLDSAGLGITRDWVKGLLKDKQDKLRSGDNIATINGQSLLDGGNITIKGGNGSGDIDLSSLQAEASANTVEATSKASAEVNVSNSKLMFTFDIPKGKDGSQGEKGDKGDTGEKGDKGDKGDPGDSSSADVEVPIFAYKLYSKTATAPTTAPTGGGYLKQGDGTYARVAPTSPSGWQLSMPTANTSQYVYLTTGVFKKDAVVESWSVPMRLSPVDSSGGSGGLGFDTEFTEYIYRSSKTENPSWSEPANDQTQDKYIPTDWNDHPAGLTEDYPYIYYRYRVRATTDSKWSAWNTDGILLWAAWGKKGQDGDGREYIFTRTVNNVAPKVPDTGSVENYETLDDYVPNPDSNGVKWTDDPTGLTVWNETTQKDEFNGTYFYEWVCQRKMSDGKWQPFTGAGGKTASQSGTASLWTRYAQDGETPEVPVTMYVYTTNGSTPVKPVATDSDFNTTTMTLTAPTGWQTSLPDWNGTSKIWVTAAVFNSKTGAVITNYAEPTCLTGTSTSTTGADTAGIEFIYKVANGVPPTNWGNDTLGLSTGYDYTYEQESAWTSSTFPDGFNTDTDDHVPTAWGWTDNPTAMDGDKVKAIYVRWRIKTGGSWAEFSKPYAWAVWGEKGTDGDGVEYIFTTTTDDTAPKVPTFSNVADTNIDDLCGTDENGVVWTDDPQGVSSDKPYEWVCQRKSHDGVWGSFTSKDGVTAALWAKFGESGVSMYRANIFIRFTPTSTKSKPDTPTGGSYDSPISSDMKTAGWCDGIPATTTDNAPAWVSFRLFTSDGKDPQESSWSEPVQCTDSAGLDVCYHAATDDGSQPDKPADNTSSNTQGGAGGWYDEPFEGAAYMAMRYKNSDGTWGAWDVFRILGEKGDPGSAIIFDIDNETANMTYDLKGELKSGPVYAYTTLKDGNTELVNGENKVQITYSVISVNDKTADSNGKYDGLTVKLNATTDSTGAITDTSADICISSKGNIRVNSIGSNTANIKDRAIVIGATYNGITYRDTMNVYLRSNMDSYEITVTAKSISVKDGGCVPETVKIGIRKYGISELKWTVLSSLDELPSGWKLTIDNEEITSFTGSNNYYLFSPSADASNYQIILYDDKNQIQDSEGISVTRDGSSGSSFLIDLDNEYDSMLYNTSGERIDQATVETTATLYEGSSAVTSGITWSIAKSKGVTSENNDDVISDNSIYASSDTDQTQEQASLTANSDGTATLVVYGIATDAKITVNANYNGNDYATAFVVKRLAGTDMYKLIVSDKAVKVDSTPDPAKITLTIGHYNSKDAYEVLKSLPSGFTLTVTGGDSDSISTTSTTDGYTFSTSASYTKYTIQLKDKDGNLLDTETIPVLHDADITDYTAYWIEVDKGSITVDGNYTIVGGSFKIQAVLRKTEDDQNKIVSTTSSASGYYKVDSLKWNAEMIVDDDWTTMSDDGKENPRTFNNGSNTTVKQIRIAATINGKITVTQYIPVVSVPESTAVQGADGITWLITPLSLTFDTDQDYTVLSHTLKDNSSEYYTLSEKPVAVSVQAYQGSTALNIAADSETDPTTFNCTAEWDSENNTSTKVVALVTGITQQTVIVDINGVDKSKRVPCASGYIQIPVVAADSNNKTYSYTPEIDFSVAFSGVTVKLQKYDEYIEGEVSTLTTGYNTLNTGYKQLTADYADIKEEVGSISLKVGQDTLESYEERTNLIPNSYYHTVFYGNLPTSTAIKVIPGNSYTLTVRGCSTISTAYLCMFVYGQKNDTTGAEWIPVTITDENGNSSETNACSFLSGTTPITTPTTKRWTITIPKQGTTGWTADTEGYFHIYVQPYVELVAGGNAETSSYYARIDWATLTVKTSVQGGYGLSKDDYLAMPNLLKGTQNCETMKVADDEDDISWRGYQNNTADGISVSDDTVTFDGEHDMFHYWKVTKPSAASSVTLYWQDAITTNPATPYTLSFYAKASAINTVIYAQWNNNDDAFCDGALDGYGVLMDKTPDSIGNMRIVLGTTWKEYSVTFWQTERASAMPTILSNTTNTVYIAAVKVREGGRVDAWTDYGVKAKDADALDLLATGIDIEKKQITLTADNLICKNNSGEDTMSLDKNGNLTISGTLNAGKIGGTTGYIVSDGYMYSQHGYDRSVTGWKESTNYTKFDPDKCWESGRMSTDAEFVPSVIFDLQKCRGQIADGNIEWNTDGTVILGQVQGDNGFEISGTTLESLSSTAMIRLGYEKSDGFTTVIQTGKSPAIDISRNANTLVNADAVIVDGAVIIKGQLKVQHQDIDTAGATYALNNSFNGGTIGVSSASVNLSAFVGYNTSGAVVPDKTQSIVMRTIVATTLTLKQADLATGVYVNGDLWSINSTVDIPKNSIIFISGYGSMVYVTFVTA